ncbi:MULTISPECIES: futalosine hydrolase [Sphingobacterium]|uniref:futalosine hydrolase n=1 Tax=Sphingobacterium TaxID=28453 RepID=UPI0013D960C1|nr:MULTISPECIES: futalosine hydrolase [unclassified Sphingobacterium]
MKPLVVAATEGEIAPSLDLLSQLQIPYLITGVGMTATAYQLGKRITQSRPDYILNIGIAGSFSKDIALGSVVNIVEDHFSELGAEDAEQFLSLEDLGFGNSMFRSSPPPNITISLPQETAITVNMVHGHTPSIHVLKKRFPGATIESMEGAAVLFVATEEGLPCLQIRAISNYVEKRNRDNWEIPLAIQNINKWLQDFLIQNK